MTRTERKQIAAALRACLPYLWDGKGKCPNHKARFICTALEGSRHEHSRAAQDVATYRLRGRYTLNDWLKEQLGYKRYRAEVTDRRMQAHRRAWVFRLIEEFES